MLVLLSLVVVCLSANNPYQEDPDIFHKTLSGSKELTAPNWASDWARIGYAIPHEALRRDLFLGNRALKKFDPVRHPYHTDAFFAWFAYLQQIVHGHHWAEENVFFPGILAQAKGVTLPPQMTSDHDTLLRALHHIGEMEARLRSAANDSKKLQELADEMRRAYSKMYDMMMPHLDEEEDTLIPIIRKHFTEAQLDVVVQDIIAKISPLDLFWELCPLTTHFLQWCYPGNGCPADEHVKFLNKVPKPVLFLGNTFFVPRYLHAAEALHSIETGYPKPYSRWPLRNERIAAIVVLTVIYAIYRIAALVCCGGRQEKVKKS